MYAAITATTMGYHGRQVNLMDQTVDTLSRVINRTYDRFAVKAEDVDYIECNATGKSILADYTQF